MKTQCNLAWAHTNTGRATGNCEITSAPLLNLHLRQVLLPPLLYSGAAEVSGHVRCSRSHSWPTGAGKFEHWSCTPNPCCHLSLPSILQGYHCQSLGPGDTLLPRAPPSHPPLSASPPPPHVLHALHLHRPALALEVGRPSGPCLLPALHCACLSTNRLECNIIF